MLRDLYLITKLKKENKMNERKTNRKLSKTIGEFKTEQFEDIYCVGIDMHYWKQRYNRQIRRIGKEIVQNELINLTMLN